MAQPVSTATPPRRRRGLKAGFFLVLILIVAVLLLAAYVWTALHYNYSDGERAGYVQKFSRKGWICKTWEGELAMANLPGSMPQIFTFTVRSDSIAHLIEQNAGKQVSLTYEQHRGVPTSCFGETEYFVTGVGRTSP